MRVAIIGGGLAGTACAYVLKNSGAYPVIYEASPSIASGASGNRVGLCNVMVTAHFDAMAQFYSRAFSDAVDLFGGIDTIDWVQCGALHLIMDERKKIRFSKAINNWSWGEDMMRLLDAQKSSQIAGLEIVHDALYLPKVGTLSPEKLCNFYARDVEVHLNHKVNSLNDIEADAIILASGFGVLGFDEAAYLPLKPVRGQVSYIKAQSLSKSLSCAMCYGGYVAPAIDGVHVLGSSFQPWLNHSEIMPQDDIDNMDKLFMAVPSMRGGYEVMDHRAAVRTASKDHFPVVGRLDEARALYISTAHGSHGIVSSLLSAKILSNMIVGEGELVSDKVIAALSPMRFI